MAEHYSPLRYPGGKAILSDFLIGVLESNPLHRIHYIEPYAGGAGAALRLLFEEHVECITINDADPRVNSFWKAITEHNEEFVKLIQNVPLNVEEWRRQRVIYEECQTSNVLELGFAMFYLNRTARSGIVHNGGPIGGYDQSGNYKIDARFNRKGLIRRIQRIGAYSDRISVSTKDGVELLQRLGDQDENGCHIFVYLDPPYYVKGAELYMNRFSDEEHEKLARFLEFGAAFPWIMTYDYVSAIIGLYKNFNQKEFYLSYSAYKRRRGKEVLIWPDSVEIKAVATEALPVVA